MEATKLLLKGREGDDTPIPVPENKATIVVITYTNRKFAKKLEDQGVPWITDKSAEESQIKALTKKTLFSVRRGGNAVREMELEAAETAILGTGKQIKIPKGISVNGIELLDNIAEIAKQKGISDVYLRTREGTTEVRQAREEDWRGAKVRTKVYFISPDKVDAKMKKEIGSKKFSFSEAKTILKELVNVTWYIHAKDHPSTLVFNMTYRQPDKEPTHQVVI